MKQVDLTWSICKKGSDSVDVGDLVICHFQPKISRITKDQFLPMKHMIKGELGIYIEHGDNRSGTVLFPKFCYKHTLAWSSLEVISESR